MKHIIILSIIVVFTTSNLFSTTYYSVIDGNWSTNQLWALTSGGKPTNFTPNQSDIIYIETDINLDVDIVIHSTGRLIVTSIGSLTSNTSSLEIKNGGSLEVYGNLQVYNLTFNNSSDIIIDESVTINILSNFENKNNTTGVVINGTLNIGGEYYNGNGSNIGGCGKIYISGEYNNWGTAYGFSNEQGIGPKEILCDNLLPVKLIDYTVVCTKTGSLIEWSTATETDNDFFTIEKSNDLINWKIVSTIAGAINSNNINEYYYNDSESNEVTTYYRIKQTDLDGNYIYFDMLSILCKLSNSSLKLIGVNASVEKLNLIISTEGLTDLNIIVSDMNGKIVSTEYISPIKGANFVTLDTNLKNGLYIVKLIQNNASTSQKLLLTSN
ncbi:MAG TPA: hypothetical protein DDX39_10900 [Bacteroidales bacterium]|nr:MAG: hypothetical protein A2W98_11150 [Bacteroidetes bacterium GWF2_33_38]OFY76601.1 MAG: hypothetical protein A2265_01830 [Bacteroidetes bacterium RIFOXYA12_FULL_33_9]OFY89253.1 MAG: hypothetical protein A2236_07945 [Bacteroidetes bacterium RIFOXYA2_FULL_33_7]HBF89140.1 hypothetical protein [Bacteroidales bacterium]